MEEGRKLSDGSRVPATPGWVLGALLVIGLAAAAAAICAVTYVAGFFDQMNR